MYPNFVTHILKYITLTEGETEVLMDYVNLMEVKKRKFLLKEGQICRCNYFVESGCLRMFFMNEKGKEQTTHFAIENWWLADNMSPTTQSPSPFYIQAVENSTILCLDYKMQDKLFDRLPKMQHYFLLVTQRAYAASQLRIKYLYDHSREDHYHYFCEKFPDFVERIPQYMLASYLGFTPEYLSEIRKNSSKRHKGK